ncbi:hypothetical protein [Paenibacillus sp. A3]|uniref:hypothetical protein n=1 Tax=Paenibacillus sp. A3 TaxID=1337054 RepID=UPI000A7F13DC|nr:hypothetical protein [Paenibacillus sp. A3]
MLNIMKATDDSGVSFTQGHAPLSFFLQMRLFLQNGIGYTEWDNGMGWGHLC